MQYLNSNSKLIHHQDDDKHEVQVHETKQKIITNQYKNKNIPQYSPLD